VERADHHPHLLAETARDLELLTCQMRKVAAL
jgi:hypothetical protein